MKLTKFLPVAAGLVLAGAASVASAATIVLPGVARPAQLPALPDLTIGGGGALALPGVPALPLTLPIPTPGGSIAAAGGIGGDAYVVKPTAIAIEGVELPALPAGSLPALPGLPH